MICCGEPWAAEYARRTQVVMESYDVDVRDSDGVDLNVAGTAIAAKLVAEELERSTGTDR